MERRAVAFMLGILAMSGGAAAWSQLAGDAGRSHALLLPPGPVDVVANFTYDGEPTMNPFMPHAMWTRHGLWTMLYEDDDAACGYWLVEELRAPVPVRSDEECTYDVLDTYLESADLVTTCNLGTSVDATLIGARSGSTMAPVWSLTGADLGLGGDPTSMNMWVYCQGSALDEATGTLYVPVAYGDITNAQDAAGALVVAIDARTGGVLWSQPLVTAPPGLPPVTGGIIGLGSQAAPSMRVHALTLTTTGIVVTARMPCSACVQLGNALPWQSVIAWTDLQGRQTGYYEARLGDPSAAGYVATNRASAASQVAVAKGPLAAIVAGAEVLVINPETSDPVATAPLQAIEPPAQWVSWPPPAWVGDRIIAGLPHSLSAYDANALAYEWAWSDGLSWLYRDLVALPSGEVLALLGDLDRGVAAVARIDSSTGAVVSRTPLSLNATPRGDGLFYASFTGAPEALLVIDPYGGVNVLGRADPALVPDARVSESYPAAGSLIQLELPARDDIVRYVVQWGDGSQDVSDGSSVLSHAYASSGARDVLVTAVLRDGRTATYATVVTVGGTAPPELTALQQAFSPEYQNYTFFVLGTLITVIGLAVTVGKHRRRFAKLERELAAVEEIRMLSVADPRGAVLALKSYRDRLPEDLARRRIDDSQYQILDIRSARLLKVLRTRMFAPYDARLSQRYHRLLDAAFEDAILQPSERLALVAALDVEEALSPAERAHVVSILDDFTSATLAH